MRLPLRSVLLAAPLLACGLTLAAAPDAEQAGDAAAAFGRALVASRADELAPVLPRTGKVRLALRRLGPEDGMFASGQVVAVFRDFLARGRVLTFEVVRVDADARTGARAVARAAITDADGRRASIGLRLGLAPEGGRWVVREVKETAE